MLARAEHTFIDGTHLLCDRARPGNFYWRQPALCSQDTGTGGASGPIQALLFYWDTRTLIVVCAVKVRPGSHCCASHAPPLCSACWRSRCMPRPPTSPHCFPASGSLGSQPSYPLHHALLRDILCSTNDETSAVQNTRFHEIHYVYC